MALKSIYVHAKVFHIVLGAVMRCQSDVNPFKGQVSEFVVCLTKFIVFV